MSTFTNISGATLYIQGFLRQSEGTLGVGSTAYIQPGGTFDGSNYYKRFTYAGMIAAGVSATEAAENAILEVTTDDGLPFSEQSTEVPNNPKVYNQTIGVGDSEEFDFETDLGGPALFMNLSTDEDIYVYLNGSSNARVTVNANESLTFNVGELLLSSVTVGNTVSGAGAASVQIIVANIL